MVLWLFRLEPRRIYARTSRVVALPSMSNIGSLASVGRPRVTTRLGAAGTIPGGSTGNGVVGALRPDAAATVGLSLGKRHAPFLRLSILYSSLIVYGSFPI